MYTFSDTVVYPKPRDVSHDATFLHVKDAFPRLAYIGSKIKVIIFWDQYMPFVL